MTTAAGFVEARKAFHASLLQSTLTINSAGVVSNADSSNTTSKAIAKGIADLLKAETIGERIAGQTSGNQFEGICGHCCKVSDEAAFCLIQRPYISKTLLT
ncbi:NgoMIV family type II restriction endonuclease, partial [Enterobacter roggenkampii]